MKKTFTSKFSDYTFLAFILIFLVSCSTHAEKESNETTAQSQNIMRQKQNAITVAAIERNSDNVYFDLIAETKNCLGEDLWLGGKIVSTDKVVLSKSGAFSKTKVFKVTELTATGLNSNNLYQVNNNDNAIQVKSDNKDMIYLQLSDGQMQLRPFPNADPIVMQYQTKPEDGYYDGTIGHWSCN